LGGGGYWLQNRQKKRKTYRKSLPKTHRGHYTIGQWAVKDITCILDAN
jgi:hypothetical protein